MSRLLSLCSQSRGSGRLLKTTQWLKEECMSQSKQVDGINIVDLARIIALGECIGCGTHFKQKAYEDLVNFLDSTKPGVHKRAVIQIKARALEILGLWMLPNETNTSSHFHQMVQTEKDQQRGSTIDFKVNENKSKFSPAFCLEWTFIYEFVPSCTIC